MEIAQAFMFELKVSKFSCKIDEAKGWFKICLLDEPLWNSDT